MGTSVRLRIDQADRQGLNTGAAEVGAQNVRTDRQKDGERDMSDMIRADCASEYFWAG
jgi:hypothetical protein